jgi:hypothetical protein
VGLTLPTGPKRNRVTPLGDLVATPLRGAWTGNRGQLHEGTDIKRFHGSQLWIICALEYKDQRLSQWAPGHFTVLFFHDEAVALAAGHRPCALCRREAYNRYRDAWTDGVVVNARPAAVDLDRRLHAERLVPRSHTRRLHEVAWPVVPDGAFVLLVGVTALVLGDAVVAWTPAGYGPRQPRPPAGMVPAITPPATMAALRAGYPVQIDQRATNVVPGHRAGPSRD